MEGDQDIYQVQAILKRKIFKGQQLYYVKWKGYPLSQATWQPYSNVSHLTIDLEPFQAQNKNTSNQKKKKIRKNHTKRDIKKSNSSKIAQYLTDKEAPIAVIKQEDYYEDNQGNYEPSENDANQANEVLEGLDRKDSKEQGSAAMKVEGGCERRVHDLTSFQNQGKKNYVIESIEKEDKLFYKMNLAGVQGTLSKQKAESIFAGQVCLYYKQRMKKILFDQHFII